MSKVLLFGGTGAMGVYLREILAERGDEVYVTSRRVHIDSEGIHYILGDAHNDEFVRNVIKEYNPDAIVDFLIYTTSLFRKRASWLSKSVKHYLFLSSYRVYADSPVILETSPRLLDVCMDEEYLKTDEYALTKARQEDVLKALPNKNWTIIRPSITYSKERFQFGCLEANVVVYRALRGLPVVMPNEMLDKQTSLTWGGDVAQMIAKLILNEKAMGESFICATSEHHSWREVADVYHRHIGLEVKECSIGEYIDLLGVPYQTQYDRMFNRIIDNSKVLKITGIDANSLLSLENGLGAELDKFIQKPHFGWIDERMNAKIDRLTYSWPSFKECSLYEIKNYLYLRYPRLSSFFPLRVIRTIRRMMR